MFDMSYYCFTKLLSDFTAEPQFSKSMLLMKHKRSKFGLFAALCIPPVTEIQFHEELKK